MSILFASIPFSIAGVVICYMCGTHCEGKYRDSCMFLSGINCGIVIMNFIRAILELITNV